MFVFDKQTSKIFRSSIADAGAERDFYKLSIEGRSINLEPAFQEIDSRLAAVFSDLATSNGLRDVADGALRDVPMLFAVQLTRTKLRRTSPAAISEQLTERGEPLGISPVTISDEQARLLHLTQLTDVTRVAEALRKKDLVVLTAPVSGPSFVISDNPVVLQNTLPYGRLGLAAPGIEIYFPISPRRCLAYLCPSHRETLVKSFDPRHPLRELSDPYSEQLMCALHAGIPATMSSSGVHFLNELQVAQSARFVYAATDEFEWAQKILDRHAELRNVRTLVNVGEMGAVPPTPYPMPPGDWVIFEVGHRHFALSVFDCTFDATQGELTFRTADIAKLGEILSEEAFDSVEFRGSRGDGGGMRDVVIDRLERDAAPFFRVRYRDEHLRALMDAITRSPTAE